jgi:PAS domain S-box-containing protein
MPQSEIARKHLHSMDSTKWRLPASTDTLARILDLVEDAIICVDREQQIVLFNQAAERVFGYAAVEIRGQTLDTLLPSGSFQDRGAHVAEFPRSKQASRPMPVRHEIVARRKNGDEFPAEASISEFQSEDGWMLTVILRDITSNPQVVPRGLQSRPIDETVSHELSPESQNQVYPMDLLRERLAQCQTSSTGRVPVAGAPIVLEDNPDSQGTPDVIASSKSMRQLLTFAKRVAASEASTILIEGESGVGKDVLARFLHASSRRRSNAFLAVNCAAIPETLLESELFGYEKGAFTDARNQKRGILELASSGTVFLDEIGELPLTLQAKLLRVLEGQEFRRLGGTKDLQVDLRVITASNRDLRKAMEQGKFRLDLYYRLNVIQMTVPPLRSRKDDIMPLARYFVALYNRKFRRKIQGFQADAWSALHAHTWPGNIRELRNAIERAMLMQDGDWIRATDLGITDSAPFDIATEDESKGDPSLAEVERATLVKALNKASWNQTRASHLLEISRDTLRYKMKTFGLKAQAESLVL